MLPFHRKKGATMLQNQKKGASGQTDKSNASCCQALSFKCRVRTNFDSVGNSKKDFDE